ncbi:FliO/MopB family protein [Rhodanobacter lindaniclasticus]
MIRDSGFGIRQALASAPAVLPAAEMNVGGELLRVIASLVAIIAMILVAGWVTRRLQRRPGGGGRRIRCVESFAIGARERLLLLDADGKRLLIGTGPGGMRTLHVYDGAAPQETVPAASNEPAKPVFGDLLARLRARP